MGRGLRTVAGSGNALFMRRTHAAASLAVIVMVV